MGMSGHWRNGLGRERLFARAKSMVQWSPCTFVQDIARCNLKLLGLKAAWTLRITALEQRVAALEVVLGGSQAR